MSAKKSRGPISDLEMLAAIAEGGFGAVEELTDTYLRKVVVAKLKDVERRGLAEWSSSMWFPWLTAEGYTLMGGLRSAELARYEVNAALEYDRAGFEAERRFAADDATDDGHNGAACP